MILMGLQTRRAAVEKLFETPASVTPILSNSPKRQGLLIVDPKHGDAALFFQPSELFEDKPEASEPDSDQ
jgi:hypothetical protein